VANNSHYTLENWVDFVRDVAPPELSNQMGAHLTEGCATCRGLHDTWKAVFGLCSAEGRFEPSASAVLLVHKMFAVARHRELAPRASVITLLFDSNAAVLAGVRTAQPTGRTLLFGRDDFLIHLHIEHPIGRNSITVTGQIMEMYITEPRVSGLKVRVVSQLKTVAAVETNDLGEFRLEIAEAHNHLLMVVEFVGTSVTIPLGELIEVQS